MQLNASSAKPVHILILEDEPAIAESLEFAMQAESFTTHWETLALSALNYLQANQVDVVIMDVGLPDMSGFEACKQLRKFSEVPVIFLTARNHEIDRIVGLEIGADDYVVKPFSPRELVARVKAILKRLKPVLNSNSNSNSNFAMAPPEFSVSNQTSSAEFVVDQASKTIQFLQHPLQLTRLEFLLLNALIAQPKRVLSREQLLDAVGAAIDAGYERSIDGHIKTLRAKLRAINATHEPIKTHRGFGYAYEPAS